MRVFSLIGILLFNNSDESDHVENFTIAPSLSGDLNISDTMSVSKSSEQKLQLDIQL